MIHVVIHCIHVHVLYLPPSNTTNDIMVHVIQAICAVKIFLKCVVMYVTLLCLVQSSQEKGFHLDLEDFLHSLLFMATELVQ